MTRHCQKCDEELPEDYPDVGLCICEECFVAAMERVAEKRALMRK